MQAPAAVLDVARLWSHSPHMDSSDQRHRFHTIWIFLACAALLALFAGTAWLAVRDKVATYDEPNDSIEAWLVTRYRDFRISPADPPLAYYWAALFQPKNAIKADFTSQEFREAAYEIGNEHGFSTDTLYCTPGNDADGFIRRSRVMLLALAVFAGAAMAGWGYRMGGGACAVAALTLFALDPNMLAHAPLVKNDVSIALAAVVLMAAVWSVGKRATAATLIVAGVMCGVVLCVKFNGPLFGLIVAIALVCRAALPTHWEFLGKTLSTFGQKLGGAVVACVLFLLISYGVIWGCYLFRFAPSSDPSYHLESRRVALRCAAAELGMENSHHLPTANEPPLSAILRIALFLEDHHLLPEPFTNGIVRNYEGTRGRPTFLMGQYSLTGWWYYFPVAYFFKTPLAMLAVVAIAPWLLWRKRGSRASTITPEQWWTGACLAVPVVIYGAAAMVGNLNIGIRHLLAIYPFIYLMAGLAFARVWRSHRRAALAAGLLLIAGLGVETMAAFPNYIAFFNPLAGGPVNRLSLLSDSNLDWGQDLKLLVDWQKQNPKTPLYLCYFGAPDPKYYGLRFTNLPGTSANLSAGEKPPEKLPAMPNGSVIAISATDLQGTYLWPFARMVYAPFRQQEPIAVLGGSIYLYPARPMPAKK